MVLYAGWVPVWYRHPSLFFLTGRPAMLESVDSWQLASKSYPDSWETIHPR
jgi:hypothetical protein